MLTVIHVVSIPAQCLVVYTVGVTMLHFRHTITCPCHPMTENPTNDFVELSDESARVLDFCHHNKPRTFTFSRPAPLTTTPRCMDSNYKAKFRNAHGLTRNSSNRRISPYQPSLTNLPCQMPHNGTWPRLKRRKLNCQSTKQKNKAKSRQIVITVFPCNTNNKHTQPLGYALLAQTSQKSI